MVLIMCPNVSPLATVAAQISNRIDSGRASIPVQYICVSFSFGLCSFQIIPLAYFHWNLPAQQKSDGFKPSCPSV